MLAAVANALQWHCVTIWFVCKTVQCYRNSAPRARLLTSCTINKMFAVTQFKNYVILFIVARKIPLTILVTVDHSWVFVPRTSTWTGSSCCKRILGLKEIKFFSVNGLVTKLKYFSYINARMAKEYSMQYWKAFELDTVSKHQTPSKMAHVCLLIV